MTYVKLTAEQKADKAQRKVVIKQRKYHLACMNKITKTYAKLLPKIEGHWSISVKDRSVKDSTYFYREKMLERFQYRNFRLWESSTGWRWNDEVFGALRCRYLIYGEKHWKELVKTRCYEMDVFDKMCIFYEAMLERDRVLGMRHSLPDEIISEVFKFL